MKIGLTGYARTGKDVIASRLVERHGFTRVAIGDYIKAQLQSLLEREMGINSFVTGGSEKERIRPLLECWGDLNFKNLLAEMHQDIAAITGDIVNSRICRVEEARAWVESGGLLVEVTKPGCTAVTDWEFHRVLNLRAAGMIGLIIYNDSTLEDLHAVVDALREGSLEYDPEISVSAKKFAATRRPLDGR